MSITSDLRGFALSCDEQTKKTLRMAADRIETELAERYVALPLDSNGVPIRAGDMLDGYGKIIEVVEIRHGRSGWVVISRDGNGYADTFAFTHHRPPTVEDILREFALRAIRESEGNYGDLDETCAEYAKRLRLVGDGEEQ